MQPSPISLASTWDLLADDYTREVAPVLTHYAHEALRLAQQVMPAAAPRKIVDVAAGPGTLALLAAARGFEVSALDFSPSMIVALREAAIAARLPNIQADLGDGMALPYADCQFDAGFSLFGLMFFPDRAAGFRELWRVLKPGAPAVIASWAPLEQNPILRAALQPLWARTLSAEQTLAMASSRAPLSDPASCQREMSEAGFDDVTVHSLVGHACYQSTAEMVASLTRSSAPFALAKKSLGKDFSALASELVQILSAQFGAGPQQMDMPANLSVGIRVSKRALGRASED